jgi:hypothetical protein
MDDLAPPKAQVARRVVFPLAVRLAVDLPYRMASGICGVPSIVDNRNFRRLTSQVLDQSDRGLKRRDRCHTERWRSGPESAVALIFTRGFRPVAGGRHSRRHSHPQAWDRRVLIRFDVFLQTRSPGNTSQSADSPVLYRWDAAQKNRVQDA